MFDYFYSLLLYFLVMFVFLISFRFTLGILGHYPINRELCNIVLYFKYIRCNLNVFFAFSLFSFSFLLYFNIYFNPFLACNNVCTYI
jgi:hypothetical protein